MTNELYRSLYNAKIIKINSCTKEEYESANPVLQYSNRPDIDGYYLFEEVTDENELILRTLVHQSMQLRTIMILALFLLIGLITAMLALLS